MLTDSISDLLIRIKNGYLARQKRVTIPYSRIKEELSKLLVRNGYLEKYEVEKLGERKARKEILVYLRYEEKSPALNDVKRISKPSLRIYTRKNKIPRVLGGLGIAIISTPQGLLTDGEARKAGLGGEVICKIW